MNTYDLLGLSTLELIAVGGGKSPTLSWGLMDHEGPLLHLDVLSGKQDKTIMLPKDLLETLYQRFADANPKGAVLISNEGYLDYAPPGLNKAQIEQLWEEGKIFQAIAEYDDKHYARLCELLPELRDPAVLARLYADPELDVQLLAEAQIEGALPLTYGPRHWRWSPEWAAYVERHKQAQAAR